MTNQAERSVPTQHFEALYANSDDPWAYETGDYEQRKYLRTVRALPRERYEAAFELGCSIGVLTSMLADRCTSVLGADCSPRAIDIARERHGAANIEYRVLRAPEELPVQRSFDLIVLSEVLYFFSPADLDAVAAFAVTASRPGATIVLVNYLGPTGHAASGDSATDGFIARVGDAARLVNQFREDHFRVDILVRREHDAG